MDQRSRDKVQHVCYVFPTGFGGVLYQSDTERRVHGMNVGDVRRVDLVHVVHREIERSPDHGEGTTALLRSDETGRLQIMQRHHVLETVGVNDFTFVVLENTRLQSAIGGRLQAY